MYKVHLVLLTHPVHGVQRVYKVHLVQLTHLVHEVQWTAHTMVAVHLAQVADKEVVVYMVVSGYVDKCLYLLNLH